MGSSTFAIALAVGAALLACWLDTRLERNRPASPMLRFGHALAALAVVRATAAVSPALAGTAAPRLQLLAVLFAVILPGLVYAFLAGMWLMRTLAEAAGAARR